MKEPVSGCNVGCTFNHNVSVLFCIHYGVKYTVGIQKNRRKDVLWSWKNVRNKNKCLIIYSSINDYNLL